MAGILKLSSCERRNQTEKERKEANEVQEIKDQRGVDRDLEEGVFGRS